jgi:hypothetical protein
MPNFLFDEADMGLARRIKRPVTKPKDKKVELKVTDFIMEASKSAFYEYALRHGCKKENLYQEWFRFSFYLKKYL